VRGQVAAAAFQAGRGFDSPSGSSRAASRADPSVVPEPPPLGGETQDAGNILSDLDGLLREYDAVDDTGDEAAALPPDGATVGGAHSAAPPGLREPDALPAARSAAHGAGFASVGVASRAGGPVWTTGHSLDELLGELGVGELEAQADTGELNAAGE
jgi:hypothetical protein